MTPPAAEPFFFGAPHQPLFGWLHRPALEGAATVGLVICNPFGYEAICTHRALRRCAELAAQAGIPSLRFDYRGTGDSSGSETDSHGMDSWVEDIGAAIDALRLRSGVREIALFGLRLGAALAIQAAQGRREVTTLIAVAPVANGRRYTRELRALQSMRSHQGLPPGASAADELAIIAGFFMADAMRTDLMSWDPARLDARGLRAALLLQRDDLPPDPALGRHFHALGVQVCEQRFSGYEAMMLDAHEAKVPEDMLRDATEWLVRECVARGTGATADAAVALQEPDRRAQVTQLGTDGCGAIVESAVFLGETLRLFAIASEPGEVSRTASARKVILLLNAGAVHHIGPNRLYVRFARLCAAQGATVVRMDQSGIGDTPPRDGSPANTVYAAHVNDDVASAIAALEARYGTDEIHCVGICSGAYYGLKAAMLGRPLRSVVVINPLTFELEELTSRTRSQYRVTSETIRYRRAALQISSWRKLLRGEVRSRAATRILAHRMAHLGGIAYRRVRRTLGMPAEGDLGAQLRNVATRNIQLLFIFSASDPGHAMLNELAGDEVKRLRRRRSLTIEIIDGADHTFTPRQSQEVLLQLLSAHFGYGTEAAASVVNR